MDDAVMDVEVVDQVDTGVDTAVDTAGQETQTDKTEDDPYSSKASREYSQWLKEMREAAKDDPRAAKFLRLSKDNHARLYQLQQTEARGLDGIRETYATVNSVVHQGEDGQELRGTAAIAAIQDELRNVQETDTRLLAGDADALKDLGEKFTNEALPKLAGPILEMVRQSNPEAYAAAVLPHFVEALRSSELVANHNSIVDILNERPPEWLPKEREAAWWADRDRRLGEKIGANSIWLNSQAKKAGELPKQQAQSTAKPEVSELDTLRKEQETQHWNTNITPKLDQHADKTFNDLLRPYEKRLRLSDAAKADLKSAFVAGVVKKAGANPVYASQIKRYHSQAKPDPNTVVNFAKVEFDKHSKNVMQNLIDTRYKSFLTGKPQVQQQAANGTKRPPVAPGVQIVTVKPANIDHKNTPLEWLHQKKYRLTDGKIVQLQR